MKKLVVMATDGFDKEAEAELKKNPDIEIKVFKGVPAAELVATAQEADILIIRSATVLTREAIGQLPNLKGILRAGVGIDNIDLAATDEHGVLVWNAPSGNFQATAELAIGLLFATARKIPFADAAAKKGVWNKKDIGTSGRQLSGSTLGIFGAGNIGMRVAKMARGLGMHVQICDPLYLGSADYKKVSFDELLSLSDFITIHAPFLPSTKHAFTLDAFRKMKPSALLIHAARGGIVKDSDLAQALDENLIAGAGIDVFEKEPFDSSYEKLLQNPKVVATPHVGASTLESQRLVGLESAEKILKVAAALVTGGKAPKILNNPQKPRLQLSFES